MSAPTLQEEFKGLRTDIDGLMIDMKTYMDKQEVEIAKHGKTTEETGALISEGHKRWDAAEANQAEFKARIDEIEAKAGRGALGLGGEGAAQKTMGLSFVESDCFKNFVNSSANNSAKLKLSEDVVMAQMLMAKARTMQFLHKAAPLGAAEIGGLVDHFRWELVQEIRKRPVMLTDLIMSLDVDSNLVNHPQETSDRELVMALDGAIGSSATTAVLKDPGIAGTYIGQTLTFSPGEGVEEAVIVLTRTPATQTITFAATANAHPDDAVITGTNFGFTPEKEHKPEGDFTILPVDTPIREIAALIGVTTAMLEDSALTQQFIDRKLPARLARSIEFQLLYGDQTDPTSLPGILTTPGIQAITQVGPDTKLDVLRRGVTLLNLAFFAATGVVLHPLDWEDIELLKGTDDHYILAQAPFQTSAVPAVWRVPVVATPVINEMQFLMADFEDAMIIFNRRNTTLSASRSHLDWFKLNLIAVRAERRLGFRVLQTPGVVDGTFI